MKVSGTYRLWFLIVGGLAVCAAVWFFLLRGGMPGTGSDASGGAGAKAPVGQASARLQVPASEVELVEPDVVRGELESETSAVSWLPKRVREQVTGLKASMVLAEFLGADYPRLAPRLEEIMLRSNPDGLDQVLRFKEHERIGDPAECLEDMKQVWLREMQAGPGYIPFPALIRVPDCFGFNRDGGKLLKAMLRNRRFNPNLEVKDTASPEYAALVGELNQELQLLLSMADDVIAAEREFVVADLAPADATHAPRHGRILFCPTVVIPEPQVSFDAVNVAEWQWLVYMGGLEVTSTRCGILAASYTADMRGVPEVASLIEGLIAFKEDLAHRMSLRVPLLPERIKAPK